MAKDGSKDSIQSLYAAGIVEVNKVIADGDSAQRKLALTTLDDLTAMMLAHTLESVQGRTALLTGLITELTEVIEAVEVKPPFAGAVATLTGLVDSARTRLAAEKKKLLPADG